MRKGGNHQKESGSDDFRRRREGDGGSGSFRAGKAYDALYTQLENAGKQANDSLTSLISAMTKGQQALQAQYDKLPSDITSALSDKAQELEDDLNKTKDAYFDAFEKAHADDIKAMNDALEQMKKDLIASIAAS